MQKLVINNFGPLEHVELDINDYTVFIGPQASGKSTIGKWIYFFKSLKYNLSQFISSVIEDQEYMHIRSEGSHSFIEGFKDLIKAKFSSFWRIEYPVNASITYHLGIGKTISLTPGDHFAEVAFSAQLSDSFKEIFDQIERYVERIGEIKEIKPLLGLSDHHKEKIAFNKIIEALRNKLFEDNRSVIYIPAGRSLLSSLSIPLQKILWSEFSSTSFEAPSLKDELGWIYNSLDYTLKDFIGEISNIKEIHSEELSVVMEESAGYNNINADIITTAESIIYKILNGSYRYERGGDKLYLKNTNSFVDLSSASSGQQESIWILLKTLQLIRSRTKCFIIIEEPEAHLYPVAQKEIVELISLFFNLNDNQVLITTHSPYILSSINNLLYAGIIGKEKPAAVEKIINKKLWIEPSKVASYFVEDGKIRSILDEELGLIKAEEIDKASAIINEEFDKLFNL